MVDFMLWFLESSLLILFVLGIRKIFSGKISYRAIYALWLVVVFRFMIPVNIIPTPFGFADNMKKSLDHLELELSTAAILLTNPYITSIKIISGRFYAWHY